MKRWLLLVASLVAAMSAAQDRASLVTTQIRVVGEVQRELTLAVDDLRKIAKRRVLAQGGGYAGVRLTDLLEEAEIRRDARHALRRTYVVATASDGYKAVFSWGELFNTPVGRDVLVAFERDGAPLRDGEGRIALISAADSRLGPRHVKWLRSIEVHRVPE
jgi:DMSO/TMAO reductase YedYZ molybdopterin-dependent catalytic subunit